MVILKPRAEGAMSGWEDGFFREIQEVAPLYHKKISLSIAKNLLTVKKFCDILLMQGSDTLKKRSSQKQRVSSK